MDSFPNCEVEFSYLHYLTLNLLRLYTMLVPVWSPDSRVDLHSSPQHYNQAPTAHKSTLATASDHW